MPDRPAASSVVESYAELLSLAVHELRTPASVVSGYLRMLLRDVEQPLSPRQRHMVEEAEKSCARIVAIVAQLSDISKLDSGAAAVKEEPFDLFRVIPEVAESVHEPGDREVRLEVQGESDGARMTGDLPRLSAAFAAFFNAVAREQPSGSVVAVDRRIAADGANRTAVVVIAPKAAVQEAYEAVPGPFDEKRGGLGLALPLARRAIERQGGRVWCPAAAESAGAASGLRGPIVVSLPIGEHTL